MPSTSMTDPANPLPSPAEVGSLVMPPEVAEALGPPELTNIEDEALFDRLVGHFATTIRPSDFVEWMWVRDLVDLSFELARYQRASKSLISMRRDKAIRMALDIKPMTTNEQIRSVLATRNDENQAVAHILRHWRRENRGLPNAALDPKYDDFKSHLENLGLSANDLDGLALISSLEEIQALHRLIGNVRSRRDQIIREIDWRRGRKIVIPRSESITEETTEFA